MGSWERRGIKISIKNEKLNPKKTLHLHFKSSISFFAILNTEHCCIYHKMLHKVSWEFMLNSLMLFYLLYEHSCFAVMCALFLRFITIAIPYLIIIRQIFLLTWYLFSLVLLILQKMSIYGGKMKQSWWRKEQ